MGRTKNVKITDLYEIKGDRITRKKEACPKCGDGVFLAEHKDRKTCGKCAFTRFNKKK